LGEPPHPFQELFVKPAQRALRSLLRFFTDIHEGEETNALLLLLNVGLILCAYYLIKPLREGWISVSDIEGLSKVEVKAYSAFFQSLLLIPIVSFYGSLSSRWKRTDLITRSTLFCMSNMVIFWALQPNFFFEGLPLTGIVFYVWVGMFGVFVVAQFWAFAADVYNNERGKRMLPLIAIGATAGAAFGSKLTAWLVEAGVVSTEWLLILALVPLSFSIWITRVVDSREGGAMLQAQEVVDAKAVPSVKEAPAWTGALGVVFNSRFLLAVAGITLLLNWVNTNGENLLFWVVQDVLREEALALGIAEGDALIRFTKDGTTIFYANFFSLVNWVALILQAFVASRLLKYGGFGVTLLLLPVVALVSYTTMALVPILIVVKMMKVAENATDYSINNTVRNVLWLPVPSDLIYKGKTVIDTLFARLGDGLAALTVMIGIQLFALPTKSFFIINVVLVGVWLACSLVVIREHRALAEGMDAAEAKA
jgi:AAA family ATP:ADP antiporter